MKKIIKNKVYDSSTAHKLGMRWIGTEFNRTGWEELYRKKTGEFFTLYHCYRDNSERIDPFTYEEAQTWAEEHLDGDEYIGIFGDPEEDGSVEALNIRISSAKMKKLRQEASKKGLSLVDMVEKLIDAM